MEVYGDADEEVSVSLGNTFAPNRMMQAAYWMNSLDGAKDEVTTTVGQLENVELVGDTRQHAGSSYWFQLNEDYNSRAKITNTSRMEMADNTQFVIDIKPDQAQGQIFNLGNALTLELLESGQLQLSASSNDGNIYVATLTNPLALNQWHQVAGSFSGGILSLTTSAETIQTPVSGQLAYSDIDVEDKTDENGNPQSSQYRLVLGEQYSGLMNSLRWYDLNSPALVTFDDGSEATTVNVGPTGATTINVNSTGNMRSFGSYLPMQSIALSSGSTEQSVDIMSTPAFEAIAGATLAAGLIENTPEFDLAFLDEPTPTPEMLAQQMQQHGQSQTSALQSYLFPNAYAYNISFWDVVKIAGMFIGLDSLGVIWDQVGNMLMGRDVDLVAFTVAVLDVLALFPPAAPLKAVTIPVKTAMKVLRVANTKAVKYLGGVIKKAFQKAKGRDFSLVFQGMAFFIVIADMMSDEEAREGFKEIGKMINSTDDFFDLLDYFSLADDELSGSSEEETAFIQATGLEGLFASLKDSKWGLFPNAHAAVPAGAGVVIGKMMKELAPVIAKSGAQSPKTLGLIGRELKTDTGKYMKKVFSNKDFLAGNLRAARSAGPKRVKQLLAAGNNKRIRPLVLIGIIAFLEEQIDSGALFPEAEMQAYDREHNLEELRKLYVTALPSFSSNSTHEGKAVTAANGAAYHLMQIAFYHATSLSAGAASDGAGQKVIGIEVPRKVWLFEANSIDNAENGSTDGGLEFGREVDILLGDRFSEEVWVEVKSWKSAGSLSKPPITKQLTGSLKQWKWKTGKGKTDSGDKNDLVGTAAHKQFSLDRVALEIGAATGDIERRAKNIPTETGLDVSLLDADWSFHKFSTRNKDKKMTTRSPSENAIEKALTKDPVGLSDTLQREHMVSLSEARSMITVGQAKALASIMQTTLKDAILEDLNESQFDILD